MPSEWPEWLCTTVLTPYWRDQSANVASQSRISMIWSQNRRSGSQAQ